MENITKAMAYLERSLSKQDRLAAIPFEAFIKLLFTKPKIIVRNVFQVFYDMVKSYVGEGIDEYPGDTESVKFVHYDCNPLFVNGADNPFFADRLFANRLMKHVEAMRSGAQQNKIYIFDGPPGCGKSTFLNNLLKKFEEYANTEQGTRYEVVWRLSPKELGGFREDSANPVLEQLSRAIENIALKQNESSEEKSTADLYNQHHQLPDEKGFSVVMPDYVEVPCPSHDNPLLMVPKRYRRTFFDELFKNDEFKWNLFANKEYNWVFKDKPCTICSTIYQALLNQVKDSRKVYQMLYARPYRFNRRLGQGISVFNPGDIPLKQYFFGNPRLQRQINSLLRNTKEINYLFSRYAKTNNGIYALMDIKSHNAARMIELHNIISEGVHKVEDIEESVNSLLMAVMNPEDKKNIQDFKSFSDRIEYIKIPYVMDLQTEVHIYRSIFGRHIDESFLPMVLHNFARVIISSRLKTRSEGMLEWIGDPDKYNLYCDKNLLLLKMELYTGHIPRWLKEEDRKSFTAKVRRRILAESDAEGEKGFSGRDSIKLFNEFYTTYTKDDKLINMSTLCNFFTKARKDLMASIPEGFIDSLCHLYNYRILQFVKESLYDYNEEQISRDIQNYLFALNFEIGSTVTSTFTQDKLEITEDFIESIENHLLGAKVNNQKRLSFRKRTQKEYTSSTLTQEIMVKGMPVTETKLYQDLHEQYVYNLKEKVLDPFLENENFRRAIKDYDKDAFKTYDKRIRDDVSFLMNNLCDKLNYTKQGAKEICMDVIDNDLAKTFAKG